MPKVEGSERLDLSRDEVWRLLNDPDTLGASIPGCRGFERDGDAERRYRTAITVAVGAVTGVYEGTVSYEDVEEPERCTIVVSGRGDKGTIDGSGAITLAESDGGTEVGYTGTFKLTGSVAGIGQRLAPGLSRKMIVETLRNLERHATTSAADDETANEPSAVPSTPESTAGPPSAATPEPFRPVSLGAPTAFAGGLVLGVVIGIIIGRLI